MSSRIPLIALILSLSVAALAQTRSNEHAQFSEPLTGEQIYSTYCALCHGADGKGGGPFTPQLKVFPPDLTQLLKSNHGVFPVMHVKEAVDGEFRKPSHGSSEMPIWGPIFRTMAHGHRDSAQVRINSLVEFLESIQEK